MAAVGKYNGQVIGIAVSFPEVLEDCTKGPPLTQFLGQKMGQRNNQKDFILLLITNRPLKIN